MKPVDNGDSSVMVAVTNNGDHDFASTVLSDSGAPLDVGYSTFDHLKVGETAYDKEFFNGSYTGGDDTVSCRVDSSQPDTPGADDPDKE
jgi:hypothetical protein